MNANRIYLVRHGENPANLSREFSSRRVDYGLTARGVLQARQTGEYFRDKDIHEIYSSPLKRAQETAEIIAQALGLAAQVAEELREIDVGDLEGRSSPEDWAFHNHILGEWFTGHVDLAFPGGEDYTSLLRRMRAALERAVAGKSGRNIIFVSHGGIFAMTLRDLCPEVDPELILRSGSGNCSIGELRVSLERGLLQCRLAGWANHAHLHGPAADPVVPHTDPDNQYPP